MGKDVEGVVMDKETHRDHGETTCERRSRVLVSSRVVDAFHRSPQCFQG